MATKYPDSVKGLHYRISNKYRYMTVSFVLERNLNYPDLGFNFTQTEGQGVVYSSQLCFLTKQDAEDFIKTYGDSWWGNDYHPFISRDTTTTLIRINKGGKIPCYTSKYCCEHYSNRISDAIKARLEVEPISNPFTEADPDIQAAQEKRKKNKEKGELQEGIIKQVIQELKAEPLKTSNSYYWDSCYAIPLNLNSNIWANDGRYNRKEICSYPALIIKVESVGEYGKKLRLETTYLKYLPLTSLYRQEIRNSGWSKFPPFWEELFKAAEIELKEKRGIQVMKNEEFGIQFSPWYIETSSWTPGIRNTAEKIVSEIKKYVSLVEEAAVAFEKVTNEFDKEDVIE